MNARDNSGRIPFRTKVGYGSAEIGLNAVETSLRLYLLIFYTDVVGLRPGLAGLAVALGLLWDAVTDPLMGAVSDRTVERGGDRRVYLPVGAVVLGVGVVATFSPPGLGGQGAMFAWLLATYCLLNLGLTILSVPYLAMGGQLTDRTHERSVLFAWRFVFANAGALVAAAVPNTLADATASGERQTGGIEAMGSFSFVLFGLIVVSALVAWRATRGARMFVTTHERPARRMSIASRCRAALVPLRTPSFPPLLAAYLIATIGIGINATVALYYYGYRLQLTPREIQVMLVVFMAVFTASLAGWVAVSKRYGKLRPVTVGALLLGVATSVLYPVLPPKAFVYPLVLGAIGIGSLVGCIVLIESILTDVIDHDCVRTGRQRPGLYFGVWRFVAKSARAGAVVGAGAVLDAVGFEPGVAQSSTVDFALAAMFGPGVGLCFASAGIILWRYRFDASKHDQVERILRKREDRAAIRGR